MSQSGTGAPKLVLPLATEIESTLSVKPALDPSSAPQSTGSPTPPGQRVLHLRSPDASPDAKAQLVEALQAKVAEQHEWGKKAWSNIQRLNDRIVEVETERDTLKTRLEAAGAELEISRLQAADADAKVLAKEPYITHKKSPT